MRGSVVEPRDYASRCFFVEEDRPDNILPAVDVTLYSNEILLNRM